MKTFTFISEIFKKFPLLLVLTTILIMLMSVLQASSLLTIGPLIDILIHPDLKNVSPLTQRVTGVMKYFGIPILLRSYLIIFVGFIVTCSVFRIFAQKSILSTKYAVIRGLMLNTFRDFFSARWQFFSSSKQGTLLNTFIRELAIVGDAFGAMASFFSSILQFVFYLAVPFYLSWQVTLVSLGATFLLSWPFIMLGKISWRLGRLNTETFNHISTVIQESFTMAKVILGFGNQHKSVDSLKSAFEGHCKAAIKSQMISTAIPALYRPLGVVVLAVALFFGRKIGIPISEMVVLLLSLHQAVVSVGDLTSKKNSLDNFFPSYEQVKKLRRRAKQFKQVTGDRMFAGFKNEVVIKRVSFAHPRRDLALKDVDIIIPKGKMIAIVGESGAGKSTLIDMLMGLNDPISGSIEFDGICLKELYINSYRKRIGYVPQDSVLFNVSIRENLLWANEKASDEEIKYACQQANADEFIEELPDKSDTIVGDRGVRLSGGQRQRIALARAILRKPDLLILDEATSSLDTHSERLIQKAIEKIALETTIIVIAHRLSTIVNADYVYVLKRGRVVEEGSYSELLQKKGQFSRMIELQAL